MWEMQTEAQNYPYDTDQENDVNQQLQKNGNEVDVQGNSFVFHYTTYYEALPCAALGTCWDSEKCKTLGV